MLRTGAGGIAVGVASRQTSGVPVNMPFLRWAGSKRQLLPRLMQYWESGYANYVEPFMGSACLFLAISPLRGRLNDLNANLVNTFRTIVAHRFRTDMKPANSRRADAVEAPPACHATAAGANQIS